MKKLLALAVVILGFTAVSFGQIGKTATATASAYIVSPISITNAGDMNFGNVAENGTAGTVVLPVVGARTYTGGVTLPAVIGTVSPAAFTIKGTTDYAFTFSVPTTATVVANGGAGTMSVDTWTSNSTGVLTGGEVTVNVGATLHVTGGQETGAYTSAIPFTVTVNYN